METSKPGSPALKRILAKAPTKLVDELASRVIFEGICGKRELQRMAIPLAIAAEDSDRRRVARSLLARSGVESTSALFQELVEEGRLGLDALPVFVDVIVQIKSMGTPGIVNLRAILETLSTEAKADLIASAFDSETGLAMIGRKAIMTSMQYRDEEEKDCSKGILAAIGLDTVPRIFQEMVQSRELELESLWPFLRIVLDIRAGESATRSPETETVPEQTAGEAEQPKPAPEEAPPESPAAPEEGTEKKPPTPKKTVCKKRQTKKLRARKESKPKIAEADKLPIDENMSPAELRNADLKLYRIDEKAMYRLICLECFRLCTAKPLIGKSYAPITKLKGNLQKRLNGDPQMKKLFDQCWKLMVANKAIILAKSNTVASLTSSTGSVLDPEIKEAVEWALENHRELTTG